MREVSQPASNGSALAGWPPVEAALRHLGKAQRGELADLLALAIARPSSTGGQVLAPLLEPTAKLGWSPQARARAVLRLIEEGVTDHSVGPTLQSRRRRALQAAFRLRDATIETEIGDEWGSSLTERFKQLQKLRGVFNNINTTQPMEVAWSRGVAALDIFLNRRFGELKTADDWVRYLDSGGSRTRVNELIEQLDQALEENDEDEFRAPSTYAQSFFVELFVTNVFMKGRAVHRRITERLVTARDSPVSYYTARGFAVGDKVSRKYVPVRALWGCSEELVTVETDHKPKQAPVTRLWFPSPLQPGEHAYFASEATFDVDTGGSDDRDWIDVDIDHHGIPRGQLLHGGRLPVQGLTIRVVFDQSYVPDAVWWYAEANENERYIQPAPDDPRILQVVGHAVAHTFSAGPCQPREHYGLSFSWPSD